MRNYVWGLAVVAAGGFVAACSASPTPVSEPEEPAAGESVVEIDFEVSQYARVYRGEDGLRVTLVPLVGGDPEEALIEVTGLPNDFDGLVLRYEKVPQGRDRWSYRTIYRGGEFHTMWQRRVQGEMRVEIYLPDAVRDSRAVTFDEEASAEVDPHDLARRHATIAADGTVAALAEFDREDREARHDEEFESRIARSLEDCGARAATSIDWSTVSDEELRRYSVSSYCGAIGAGLRNLCLYPQGRELVQSQVRAIHCEFGEAHAVGRTAEGKLTWTGHFEGVNAEQAASHLVRRYFGRDRVVLRAGDRSVYLTLDPGDGDVPVHFSEGGHEFFEHAEATRTSSGNSRFLFGAGAPSRLTYRDDAWKLTCGDREFELSELPAAQAAQLLDGKALGEHAFKRVPFALARDDRGRYYYVDRLADRYGGKGFRVFTGMRGNMQLTRLVDVVDDSEGTVFSTAGGDLRLIIDRNEVGQASWIRNDRPTPLTVLPLHRNEELIYRGLGAYTGERLGSVCEAL
jgi:hypothetical protein